MAQFPLTTSAVRISQTLTQGGAIQNTGAQTVYLGNDSSVSPLNYGLSVSPGASVQWESGAELWACADAPGSTVNVLYGARAVTVSEMNAVVTGDVTATIDNASLDVQVQGTVPVDIQNAVINADVTGNIVIDSGTVNVGNDVRVLGGGEGIYSATSAGDIVTLDVPKGTINYSAYTVEVGTSAHANGDVYYHQLIMGGTTIASFFTYDLPTSVIRLGYPTFVRVTVPNYENDPTKSLTVDSERVTAISGTASRTITVKGSSASVSEPTQDMPRTLGNPAEVSQTFANGSTFIYLPPSVTPYRVRFAGTNTAPNYNLIHLQTYDYLLNTWLTAQSYIDRDAGGNKLAANGNRDVIVPGTGWLYRLGLNAGATFAGGITAVAINK